MIHGGVMEEEKIKLAIQMLGAIKNVLDDKLIDQYVRDTYKLFCD
jgi:hypothetical protein